MVQFSITSSCRGVAFVTGIGHKLAVLYILILFKYNTAHLCPIPVSPIILSAPL